MCQLEDILNKGSISKETFKATGLKWGDLLSIRNDYIEYKGDLDLPAKNIVNDLQGIENVHSIRYRIKKPDKLILKIIRKKIDYPDREITIDNYKKQITDLIGVRALYLFKSSWLGIHTQIRDKFKRTREKPTAYYRKGDSENELIAYKSNGCKIKPHDNYYRSIHYLINYPQNKDNYIVEIQLRTIFEEGWSEIDHALRYPDFTGEPLLNLHLSTFNRIAGSADEMGTVAQDLKYNLTMKKIKQIKDSPEGNGDNNNITKNYDETFLPIVPGNIAMSGSLLRPEIPDDVLEAVHNFKPPEIPKELLETIRNFKPPEIPKELLETIRNFKPPEIPKELLETIRNIKISEQSITEKLLRISQNSPKNQLKSNITLNLLDKGKKESK